MTFIHRFVQSVKRNGLALFLPALVSYIRHLVTTDKLVYNYSVVLFINGFLQNFLKFMNMRVVVPVEPTPIRYLPKSYCYGLNNRNLKECEKTFTVEICEYCFQIINVAISSSKKITAIKSQQPPPLQSASPPTPTPPPEIKKEVSKDIGSDDCVSDFSLSYIKDEEEEELKPEKASEQTTTTTKKRKNTVSKSTKSDNKKLKKKDNQTLNNNNTATPSGNAIAKKFIKRNTHKTRIYTDELDPTLQLKCHEKNHTSISVKLFTINSRGFNRNEIVWMINSNTKYHIKLSDDLSVISIRDKKKTDVYNIHALDIPFNKGVDCFEILLGIKQQTRRHQLVSTTDPVSSKKEAIFKANCCDICYLKRYYCV